MNEFRVRIPDLDGEEWTWCSGRNPALAAENYVQKMAEPGEWPRRDGDELTVLVEVVTEVWEFSVRASMDWDYIANRKSRTLGSGVVVRDATPEEQKNALDEAVRKQ